MPKPRTAPRLTLWDGPRLPRHPDDEVCGGGRRVIRKRIDDEYDADMFYGYAVTAQRRISDADAA